MNLIFTCGGTAGHINPAIAVANMMKERDPDGKILFIGAVGHMEEKLVPQAGFEVKCLPGSGLSRKLNPAGIKKNLYAVKCVLDAVKEWRVKAGIPADVPVLPETAGAPAEKALVPYARTNARIALFPGRKQA